MSAELRSHSFDGIQEFDNRLPNWWLWTFYLACIFSVFYWLHYHTLGTGDLPEEAYVAEQRRAAAELEARLAANPITDDVLRKLASEPSFVADGKALFEQQNLCAQCHAADGSAMGQNGAFLAGANLTDDWWIYGSRPMDIYDTIMKGREADTKLGTFGGMPKWDQLGIGSVQRLVAYVLSIKGTDVKGGKPHEDYAKQEQ
jgi:cytochrome c oxidase cbb3-type subunit 3